MRRLCHAGEPGYAAAHFNDPVTVPAASDGEIRVADGATARRRIMEDPLNKPFGISRDVIPWMLPPVAAGALVFDQRLL